LAVTGAVVVAIYLLSSWILMLFLPPDSAALPIAHHISAVATWSFMALSITFTLFGVVRATGAVWPPLFILIISMWIVRVPFADLFIPRFGADAIWWSFPLGTISSAGLASLYYRFGGWRKSTFMARGGEGETSLAIAEGLAAEG
jgi:Na+-driven multidrug efflux pump